MPGSSELGLNVKRNVYLQGIQMMSLGADDAESAEAADEKMVDQIFHKRDDASRAAAAAERKAETEKFFGKNFRPRQTTRTFHEITNEPPPPRRNARTNSPS